MPIAKYFTTVGIILVALLFVANWYLPEPPVVFADRSIEKTTIRIKSARKWPEKIVFDTNQPMPLVGDIRASERLPQSIPDDATGKSDFEHVAQLKQPLQLASASHERGRHKVAKGHRLIRIAVLPMMGRWRNQRSSSGPVMVRGTFTPSLAMSSPW